MVAVLAGKAPTQTAYADAFTSAARRLGADTFTLVADDTPFDGTVGQTPLAGNTAAINALKQADLLVDLVFLLFSAEQIEIQESGTRVLLCIEPPEILSRMFPTKDLRRRAEKSEELLRNSRELRITSEAGTDVVYSLGKYTPLTEYGYTDTPGRWDHWPAGLVASQAYEEGVNGTVVLAPGDIIFPFNSYVSTPIRLDIEDGYIRKIRGGLDASLLEDYMSGFEDPQAFAVSHIGWGLNERARWSALHVDSRTIGMDGRSFLGNVMFSTGPNTEFGGTNNSMCHLDIPMRGSSLALDGRTLIEGGKVVLDELVPQPE
ncbi:leucyl aminopeptidase [Pseudonocardia sp. H11422]|uniref:leucyl aminopeptidase n=1 Tax=Pseudonocardia sp. H11422 TaxID=2835866 RepID=UPI0027E30D62|nr:leucyl aminopeptidase [Pseudonocardia sp. H11422]